MKRPMRERIDAAVDFALEWSPMADADERMWVIDQMLRTLLGDKEYEKVITEHNDFCKKIGVPLWDIGESGE